LGRYYRGDFNARIDRECKRGLEEEKKMSWRNSKDRETNREGRDLLGLLEDRGWEMANGNNRGDETGEWDGRTQGEEESS